MAFKVSVLPDCPKVEDGTINAFGFRVFDAGDQKVFSMLMKKELFAAAGCVTRCCNGRYVDCKNFAKWAKQNGFADLLKRDPKTMERSNSHIADEE